MRVILRPQGYTILRFFGKSDEFYFFLKDLEVYVDEHYYVDPLDNSKQKIKGPVSQFRQFQVRLFFNMITFF
jgi:hypothetical protein